jgi:hypothetical protein
MWREGKWNPLGRGAKMQASPILKEIEIGGVGA